MGETAMEQEKNRLGKAGGSRFGKWFQRDNLIVLVLSGILLFVIALPVEKKENSANTRTEKPAVTEEATESASEAVTVSASTASTDYAAYLEQKLESTLKSIKGVGKVEVMLTLQSSEELIVEKDSPVVRSNTNETDSEGGSRMISQMDSGETTVYSTVGTDSKPYVVKTISPKVEGVLIVAEGAGSASVNKSITEIARALFGVEAHKVKVVAMENAK